jgi:hypothetical protein
VITQWTRNPLCSISPMINGPHRRFNRCLVLWLTLDLHRRSLLFRIGLTGDLIIIYLRRFNFFLFVFHAQPPPHLLPPPRHPHRSTSVNDHPVFSSTTVPRSYHLTSLPLPRCPTSSPPSIAAVVVLCVLCHHRGTLCSASPRLLVLPSPANSSRLDGSRQEEGQGARG